GGRRSATPVIFRSARVWGPPTDAARAVASSPLAGEGAASHTALVARRSLCVFSRRHALSASAPTPDPSPPRFAWGEGNPSAVPLPGIFQNVHAGAPAVDQIDAAVLVGADVVRLDRLLAVGIFRHVTADFDRTERIAHVDRAQAGVEIGEEHEVRPRAFGGN